MIALLLVIGVTASVKNQRVEVGDPVSVTVQATARPGTAVTFYPPASSLPAYEVVEKTPQMVQAGGDGTASFVYQVIPYAAAKATLPSTKVEIGGVAQHSNPVVLDPFNPLGTKAKDAQPTDIRDIRPFPTPVPWWVWLSLAVLLAGALWLFLRKTSPEAARKKPLAPTVPQPTLADAIDAVRRIAENPPREREAIREAHFVVAEAVRRYVEERWEVPASRQTTEEFLAAFATRGRSSRGSLAPFGPRFGMGVEMLPAVLEACDRVKWAGDRVGPDDTVQLARTALDFFAASRATIAGLGGPEAGQGLPPGVGGQ